MSPSSTAINHPNQFFEESQKLKGHHSGDSSYHNGDVSIHNGDKTNHNDCKSIQTIYIIYF